MKKNKKHYDKYKKFDVVYADFGRNPHGVQGGIRPGIVVSCDASNHGGAPQISVVPLSSKLKDNPVHVIVEPSEIRGYALSNRSDFMPEDIQTLNKGCVRFKSGYIPGESEIREAMDRAMIMQLNLLPVARKMVLEELEMMPGIDGFELCKRIRALVDCPILFLTAKTEENSLVNGLSLGADDYISKPFGVMELRARINAHLRREHREHSVRMVLGRVCIQISQKKLLVDDKELPLTKAEYEICEFLAKNRGQVFSKEQILEAVFGFDNESNDSTIITHIKNIRAKFADYDYTPIKTVWGIGYKWEE